jgi:hypothetical protein
MSVTLWSDVVHATGRTGSIDVDPVPPDGHHHTTTTLEIT